MKHMCECCDYETDKLSSYKKHVITQKHAEKVRESINKSSNILEQSLNNPTTKQIGHICPFCNNNFANSSNLTRHKKICGEKNRIQVNHINEVEKYKQESIHLHEINDILKEENAHLKTLINNAGAVVKTSVSALSFVAENYNKAPVLKQLKTYTYLEEADNDDDNFDLTRMLFNQHRDKTIIKYLGDIIVAAYKKDNPAKQAIWSSDTVRLTYVIRELINKKPDWTVDKKGVKTTKYIIEPFLEYIREVMDQFLESNMLIDHLDDSDWVMKRRMDDISTAREICFLIKNKTFTDELLKYIAPYFYLNKTDNLIEN